jgi:glutathione S-transferase
MLKIWGRVNSINVKKVLWCCAELGVPYERVDAGLQFGVVGTPEYGQLNPNRLVPTIDDGGFVLWESHAIVRHLARKHGMGRLCPRDIHAQADVDRWMDWHATTIWPAMRPVFWGLIRTPPDRRDPAEIEAGRTRLVSAFGILERHLSDRPYLGGADFTMGDIPVATSLYYWFSLPIDRPTMPRVEEYYRRISARPPYPGIVAIPLT